MQSIGATCPRCVARNAQVAGKGVLRQRACHHANSPPVPPIDLRRSSIERQIYSTRSSVLSIHLPIDGVALIEQLVKRHPSWRRNLQALAVKTYCSSRVSVKVTDSSTVSSRLSWDHLGRDAIESGCRKCLTASWIYYTGARFFLLSLGGGRNERVDERSISLRRSGWWPWGWRSRSDMRAEGE